jgi:hypothetical protein
MSEALGVIDWPVEVMTRLLGTHKRTVLAWLTGRKEIPESVAAWITSLSEAHAALTPPKDWRRKP